MLDNFCPVSNFPFLEKEVEMVVIQQFQRNLSKVDYVDLFQLVFRLGHEIETTLIALVDDLW